MPGRGGGVRSEPGGVALVGAKGHGRPQGGVTLPLMVYTARGGPGGTGCGEGRAGGSGLAGLQGQGKGARAGKVWPMLAVK